MSDRFRWLMRDSGPRVAPWDVDLTASEAFATVPSRGAIVEDWLLTLPRHAVINIASLARTERIALLAQARDTAAVSNRSPHFTTFFEHGPVRVGTPAGCGVDHAHLHAVPLAFDLLEALPDDMGWHPVDMNDPWETLGGRDYLVIGCASTWLACEPQVPTSQFFRRQIADAVTGGYGWDHNEHPWINNVRRTVDRFAARRRTAAP